MSDLSRNDYWRMIPSSVIVVHVRRTVTHHPHPETRNGDPRWIHESHPHVYLHPTPPSEREQRDLTADRDQDGIPRLPGDIP